MPVSKSDSPGAERSGVTTKDVGTPNPQSLRDLAEDLPEKDGVQKAIKKAMLADSAQEEAKEKVKVVEASPDASDTPSGHALKEVAGISDDTKRGEEYLRHKTAKRWGYAPVES